MAGAPPSRVTSAGSSAAGGIEQHRDRARVARNDDVRPAVAVHVAERQRARARRVDQGGGREGSVAFPEENEHAVSGRDDVEVVVAVQVSQGDGAGAVTDEVIDL